MIAYNVGARVYVTIGDDGAHAKYVWARAAEAPKGNEKHAEKKQQNLDRRILTRKHDKCVHDITMGT